MAFEVARAYDENKNLVPLYILTDGEVPEVTPGFTAVVSGVDKVGGKTIITVIIAQTSSNPSGGLADSDVNESYFSWDKDNITVKIYNNSDFNLTVGGYIRFSLSSSGFISLKVDTITISSHSNVDCDLGSSSYSDSYSMYKLSAVLTIQRNN